MKWTDDPKALLAFDALLRNCRPDVDSLMKEMTRHLKPSETAGIFIAMAKFVVIYDDHRQFNPEEDLGLSFHIALNRLMEQPSTKQLMSRLMGTMVNSTYGVE